MMNDISECEPDHIDWHEACLCRICEHNTETLIQPGIYLGAGLIVTAAHDGRLLKGNLVTVEICECNDPITGKVVEREDKDSLDFVIIRADIPPFHCLSDEYPIKKMITCANVSRKERFMMQFFPGGGRYGHEMEGYIKRARSYGQRNSDLFDLQLENNDEFENQMSGSPIFVSSAIDRYVLAGHFIVFLKKLKELPGGYSEFAKNDRQIGHAFPLERVIRDSQALKKVVANIPSIENLKKIGVPETVTFMDTTGGTDSLGKLQEKDVNVIRSSADFRNMIHSKHKKKIGLLSWRRIDRSLQTIMEDSKRAGRTFPFWGYFIILEHIPKRTQVIESLRIIMRRNSLRQNCWCFRYYRGNEYPYLRHLRQCQDYLTIEPLLFAEFSVEEGNNGRH